MASLPDVLALAQIVDGSEIVAADHRNNYTAIQTCVNQLIDFLAAEGFVSKTTVSSLAGGPPAAPADGDIWVATDVDIGGTRWMFQYNAASGSASKWEFIGGPPLFVQGVAANLSVVVVRGGDYLWHWAVDASPAATFFQDVLGASSGVLSGNAAGQDGSGARGSIGGTAAVSGAAAGATFAHDITSAASIFSVSSAVTPIRIS